MTQPEQPPTLEEMREVFRRMQVRMRNYALHKQGRIGPRTFVMLRDLNLDADLFETPPEQIGADLDLEALRNSDHPRRIKLPKGPLLVYVTTGDEPTRMLIEIPVLLLSDLPGVRQVAFCILDRMFDEDPLSVTPKTKAIMDSSRDALASENPDGWRSHAITLYDALNDDVLVSLKGVRQCLACQPVLGDSLQDYVERILYPSVSSIESIALDVQNPETDHATITSLVASTVNEANDLGSACAQYYERLGYLPLAPAYAMGSMATSWLSKHPDTNAWDAIWNWSNNAFGPIPKYHACSVFVQNPDWIPEDKLPDLWREIIDVLKDSGVKDLVRIEHEPWALRRDLARHLSYHLESHLPGNNGASIACFCWWLADKTASLFPDKPESAQFYRKNWIDPAISQSTNVWLAAGPQIAKSFIRYVTAVNPTPWAASLLSMMGQNLDQLAPLDQTEEIWKAFHDSVVSNLVAAFPVNKESPEDPTFALECGLTSVAHAWASRLPEEPRGGITGLIEKTRLLSNDDKLCKALRDLDDSAMPDQVAVAFALKAKAYFEPEIGPTVWEILSDSAWRKRTLTTVQEQVLGLLIEAFMLMAIDHQNKWFELFPHYIAELAEQTDDEERRKQLFLYVIHLSLTSDTVSAVRRLLRGNQKLAFMKVTEEYRQHVENMWRNYPPWVQARMRGLLASLRIVRGIYKF